MVQTYRKTIGSNVWHFCSGCATWPTQNYIESQNPKKIEDAELCAECIARHNIGDCERHSNPNFMVQRKCPVIINGKECGLDLTAIEEEESTKKFSELFQCGLGHRTRFL